MKKFLFTIGVCCSLLMFALPVFANVNVADQVTAQLGAGAAAADFGTAKDPRDVIAGVIQVVLTLLGTIFLALIVFGGFRIFTAAGDESKVDKGKSYIKNSTIGLAIVLLSYSITLFVTTQVLESVTPGATQGGIDPGERVMCCDMIWKGVFVDDFESRVVQAPGECTNLCDGSENAPDTCLVSTLSRTECLEK
ncbi:MAG: pilin [Candidatus Magasanikbacteria bacterium]